jgi:hypothetical protein
VSVTGAINGKRYRITQRVEKTEDHFHAVYKGRDIQIDREDDGSFYIIVTHIESGMHDYDGWWDESRHFIRTIDEAIEEALKGAMLV